jgi:hypothetical protein
MMPLGLKALKVTVTDNEKELVAALEADIQIWESLVRYVERSIDLSDKRNHAAMTLADCANGLLNTVLYSAR